MSGGVDPTRNDISSRKVDQEIERKEPHHESPSSSSKKEPQLFLRYRHLQSLAIIIIFSATALVSLQHSAFLIFSFIYMYFLSKVAFPLLQTKEAPVFSPQQVKLLGRYVTVGAITGLFLPIAHIIEGVYVGDKEGAKAAATHVFLLSSQIFMEGLAFSGKFSLPIRVFVPVFYNSRRIFAIVDWLRYEYFSNNFGEEGLLGQRRIYVGRGLAVANMGFWCFNLFGFLLPVYLPRAFSRYYSAYKLQD